MTSQIDPEPISGKLAKFSGIGLGNTLLHTGIVVAFVEILHIHPSIANAIAFIFANIFSYWANSRWSFRRPSSLKQYGRFLFVSLIGLSITIAISSLASWAGWNYLIGLILVFLALPMLTFFLHYRWTFKL